MKKIVITGLGLVTPLGNDKKTSWENLINGESGIDTIKSFDVAAYPAKIGGEVKGFECNVVDQKTLRRMDKFVQFALQAASEAIKDSQIEFEKENKDRIGVIIGAGIGGLRVIEAQHSILLSGGPSRVSPLLIPMLIPDMAAGQVAICFGLKGPNFATVSACASGSHALAVSFELLRSGKADVVISGGTESCITPLGLAGFSTMKALSTRNDQPRKASRPFDKMRDGFIMGEGSGIAVLETEEHAKNRGASIYAEFIGYGMSCDAYHITAPDPEGYGPYLCMKSAVEDSGIDISDVDYINAHGTSTQFNDRSETKAIKKLFGEKAYNIPVSSIKSMTGHLLGAAGAVEFVTTVLTIFNGIIPPTINQEYPDPDCDLDYIPNKSRETEVKTALSNSFGFGGHNICLAIKKYINT